MPKNWVLKIDPRPKQTQCHRLHVDVPEEILLYPQAKLYPLQNLNLELLTRRSRKQGTDLFEYHLGLL